MLPRRCLPRQTYHLTRRCSQRQLLLTPDRTTRAIFHYALALASARTDVQVHALVVEANHFHMIVTDHEVPALPAFVHQLDQLVARAMNARLGRGENFWAPGSFSSVELHGKDTVWEHMLYVLSNPTKDGLTRDLKSWPGLKSLPEQIGAPPVVVRKPETAFFGGRRPKGIRRDFGPEGERLPRRPRPKRERLQDAARAARSLLPDAVPFRFSVPPQFRRQGVETFQRQLHDALELRLLKIREERRAEGKPGFMGPAAVRAQSPFAQAGHTEPQFKRNPRIACRGNNRWRILLLAGLKAWRELYRQARQAWARGKRRRPFPHGSYALPTFHSARVAEDAEVYFGLSPPLLAPTSTQPIE